MAQQGRVQVRDLPAEARLRPAPMQSSTYAAPARVSGDQNLARLSDALGSFSGSLGNLMPVVGQVDKEARAREDAIFQKRMAGMTLGEVRTEIKEGRMAVTDDKFANATRQNVYGQKWAQSEAALVEQELQTTFDWENGDPEKFLAERFKTAVEGSGLTDPNAIASAGRAWDQFKMGVLQRQEKYRTDRVVQSNADTAFTVIADKSAEFAKQGQKPEIFARNMARMRTELGVQGSLGASEEMLDQEYLNAAERMVSTHPEYAAAMLDAEFDGRAGRTSLSNNREYRDRVLRIKAEAAKTIGKRNDANILTDLNTNADSLLATDRLDRATDFSYTDSTGEQKTVSAQKIKDDAFNRYLNRSPQIAQDTKETTTQTMARELKKAQASGIDHPRLKATVSGIASGASPDLAQDPESLAVYMEKVNTARWLHNTSKNTYMAYTTDADRDFMESFRVAKEELTGEDGRQYSDSAALEFAIRTSQPLMVDGLNFTREQNEQIDRSVDKLAKTPGWLFGTNTSTPWNAAAGKQRVASLAKRFVRGNMDPDKAIDLAQEAVQRNSITYRGMLLQVGKAAMPEGFETSLDDIIGDFAKRNPGVLKDRDITESDISIMPIGDINTSGGRFVLFDKESGGYVMDDKSGQPFYVTLQSIRDRSREISDERTFKAADDITVNGAAAARGLVPRVGPDGAKVFVNPKTRETFDISVPERGGKAKITNRGKRLSGRGGTQEGTFNEGVLNPVMNWFNGLRDQARENGERSAENFGRAASSLADMVNPPPTEQRTRKRNTAQ